MVWMILICVVILAGIVLGSVWFGHWITMRAFSYQHPMTGSMTTTAADEPGAMHYDPDPDDEEPDVTLSASQSLEALEKLGVAPEDYLGPDGPPGFVQMGDNEPHIPEEDKDV